MHGCTPPIAGRIGPNSRDPFTARVIAAVGMTTTERYVVEAHDERRLPWSGVAQAYRAATGQPMTAELAQAIYAAVIRRIPGAIAAVGVAEAATDEGSGSRFESRGSRGGSATAPSILAPAPSPLRRAA